MALPRVNAVVVGSGAGGGVVACQLAEAGLSVVLLERGRWHSPFEERKDDLVNQRNSSLGVAYGPDEEKNPRVFVDLEGRERVVYPHQGEYQPNAACVGGGTVSYGAQAWRYMPQDFRMRSTYGALEGSTLDDWPISYDDLEPFYERAEYELGVSGDVEPNVFKGPRNKPLPMPPMTPKSREYEILKTAALRLGLHPFDTPLLINSVPYNGRSACMRIRWCVGFGCETGAKNGSQNTVIPRALATGNAWLRTECKVKEVLVDDRGRATGVAYFDENDRLAGADGGRGRRVRRGDRVGAAAAPLEEPAPPQRPRQPPRLGGPQPQRAHLHRRGRPLRAGDLRRHRPRRLHRDLRLQPRHAGPAGRRHARQRVHPPALPVLERPAAGTPSWGQAHKDFMRRYYRRNIDDPGPHAGDADLGRPRASSTRR